MTTDMSEENLAEQESAQDSISEQTTDAESEMISRSEYEERMAVKDKAIADLRARLESSTASNDDDTDINDVDAIVERAKREAVREIREAEISRYKETSVAQMYQTEWGKDYAPENDPTGSKMSKLNEALKAINELHPVNSATDLTRNLRLADQVVKGRVDDSAEQAEEARQGAAQAAMASGAMGSTVKRADTITSKLSQEEQQILRANGIDPATYKG